MSDFNSFYYTFQPVANADEIICDLNKVLFQTENNDERCISLFDLALWLRQFIREYSEIKQNYREFICQSLRMGFPNPSICGFAIDDQRRLQFELCENFTEELIYKKIILEKKYNDLYIVKSQTLSAQEVLNLAGSELSLLYDELLKYYDFNQIDTYKLEPVNTDFLVELTPNNIIIRFKDKASNIKYSIELQNITCNCNSMKVLDALSNNETDLFKNIYVNINSLPYYMQEPLHKKREEQLLEREKEEKKLTLKRRFFPWSD